MLQSKSMLNVVIMGGGNGGAVSIRAVKDLPDGIKVSAVISMSDSGGSSGRLRGEFNTLPPGDIMRAVLAMSTYDYDVLKNIFHKNRFADAGKLTGHNLGNLFLVLCEQYGGSYTDSVRALEQAVEAVGHVYPATLDKTDLVAELTNGQIVRTEAAIDQPDYDRNLKIKKVWLEPAGKICPEARKAITEADYIILGPGSLYTSIIAAVLPKGVRQAIDENKKAKLIYVIGNACHTDGETGSRDVAGIVEALDSYLPRQLDLVVYNESRLNARQKEKYVRKGWTLLRDNGNLLGKRFLRANYELNEGGVCPVKLGKIFKKILCG